MTRAALAIAVIAGLAPRAHADDDGAPKLSLPTESDRVAWTRPGFRLALGLELGDLLGLRGAPSGRGIGVYVRAGLRLDETWSLVTSFAYDSVHGGGSDGLSGLHFLGTIDPTWHVTRSFALAIGVGFGGFVEGHTNRPDVDPLPSTLDSSYTFPGASPPLPSCTSGVGGAGIARAEYAWVIGPRGETNVALELLGQYTTCTESTGRVQPDTAQPIVRTQYWPHVGALVTWGFTWR